MEVLMVVLGIVAGLVVLYVPGRRIRITQTKTDLIIGWKPKPQPVEAPAPVVDWGYVRMVEMAVWGKHFHTLDGRCFQDGISPYGVDHEPSLVIKPWPAVTAEDIKNMTMREWAAFRLANQGQFPTRPSILMPASPWGYTIDDKLRRAGLSPDTTDVEQWDQTSDRRGDLEKFSARYHGGRHYLATRHGDYWYVDRNY